MGVKPSDSLGFRAAEPATYTAIYTETHTETIDGYLRLPCPSIATGGTGRSGIAIS